MFGSRGLTATIVPDQCVSPKWLCTTLWSQKGLPLASVGFAFCPIVCHDAPSLLLYASFAAVVWLAVQQ
jgi:hypothetical protein